jgi:hypothetical protein
VRRRSVHSTVLCEPLQCHSLISKHFHKDDFVDPSLVETCLKVFKTIMVFDHIRLHIRDMLIKIIEFLFSLFHDAAIGSQVK